MKKNEIVTVINSFIDLPLKNFTPSEMNLLTTFLARCKNEGTNLVEMDFSEIREISKYTYRGQKELINDIATTNNKLQTLKFAFEMQPGVLRQLVLFPTFDIDSNEMKLRIKVNEDFKYILNDFDFGFTSYEASIHNGLNSRFSKMCFKQLRKFRRTGLWIVTLEQFRELLDIPEKYRQSDIDNRVLKPVREELSPLFPEFRIEKRYERSHRGRPTVSGYEFRWNAKLTKDGYDEDSIVEAEEVGTTHEDKPEKSGFICPECGKELYKKTINGSECYCHPDGWKKDAPCKKIYNTVSDIREAETKKEYGSFRGFSTGSSDISSIINDIASNAAKSQKSEIDERAALMKAVPELSKEFANGYMFLLDNVENKMTNASDKAEIEAAIALARNYQKKMEATVIERGFKAEDIYRLVYKDEISSLVRNYKK